MSNNSIWPIDRALSGATTSGQSVPGSNGTEGVLCIPQSSSIARASPSDCLKSYPGPLLRGILPLSRDAVSVLYSYNWLDLVLLRVKNRRQSYIIWIYLLFLLWDPEEIYDPVTVFLSFNSYIWWICSF